VSYERASQAYTQSAVLSAAPEQLVVMLYDGAIRFMHQAQVAMQHGEREIAREKLLRAEDILNELNNSLDAQNGGEIANSLRSLYLWMKRQIMESLIKQDIQPLEECLIQLRELRDAWSAAANTPIAVQPSLEA
jgi:flagellar protein FliS